MDRYLDTGLKRRCFFQIVYLLAAAWIVLTYIKTALVIIAISSYEDMFAALSDAAMESSYASRLVLGCMSMPVCDIAAVIENMLSALRMADTVFLFLSFLLLFSDMYQKVRKKYSVFLIAFAVQLIFLGGIAWIAAGSSSFWEVIRYVKVMGWFMLLLQILLSVICFLCILQTIRNYKDALAYDAVEITDVL